MMSSNGSALSASLLFVITLAGSAPAESATLSGRLTAAGSPVRDCIISLYRLDVAQSRYTETIVTRTEEDGTFSFKRLPPAKYVLVARQGSLRLFQGIVDVTAGDVVKDINLPDPFSGRWKLSATRSTLGPFANLKEEEREYRRAANAVSMSWTRTLAGNHKNSGSYEIPCDGAEHHANDQVVSCRFAGPNRVEGYQSPPPSYYVRTVDGDTLTVSTFADAEHKKRTSELVFERLK